MARNTYQTYLMHSTTGSTYTKLIDIKSFPNLGGAPEAIETTTLSDPMQTFIAGIQSLGGALEFPANYNLDDLIRLKVLEGKTERYAVWFGGTRSGGIEIPSGDEGKFEFEGQLSVFPTGGGVNEPVELTVSITPSTPIELIED